MSIRWYPTSRCKRREATTTARRAAVSTGAPRSPRSARCAAPPARARRGARPSATLSRFQRNSGSRSSARRAISGAETRAGRRETAVTWSPPRHRVRASREASREGSHLPRGLSGRACAGASLPACASSPGPCGASRIGSWASMLVSRVREKAGRSARLSDRQIRAPGCWPPSSCRCCRPPPRRTPSALP